MVKKIDGKPWYMSKTIWSAIILAVLTIVSAFGVVIPASVYAVLTAAGLYSARTGTKVITK